MTGSYRIKDAKLIKAAAIYGSLRAIYGYQEVDFDEYGNREYVATRGHEKISEEKEWAKTILVGIKKNKKIPNEIKQYEVEFKKTIKNPDGAIWNETWKKTNGNKKLLLGFKFTRALAVIDKSLYRGAGDE